MNKLKNKQRQIVDFFRQDIDLGDVILVSQNGNYVPGKVLSIAKRCLSLSCERAFYKRNRWNNNTKKTEPYDSVSVANSIPWKDRIGFEYIKIALSKHNGQKYIYLHYDQNAQQHIINLTKLNIYHETP